MTNDLEIAPNSGLVSAEEWRVRVDLAAVYRLVAAHGWDDGIATHISARVPGEDHHFLINPMGLYFEEITASSLVKIDLDGNIIDDTPFTINKVGFTIHSAVHGAREDAQCVIHLHTHDGTAVSAQEHGLLPLTQHAMVISGDIAYHEYEGIALELDERQRLIEDLGDKNLLILRNHGTLCAAQTCADAWMRMFTLERACSIQIRALAGGTAISRVQRSVPERVMGQMAQMGNIGSLAWPGALRWLDRRDPSYRN